MANFEEKLKYFAVELYKINAVKFGEFKMKIGIMSPIYFDLRVIVSYPKLLDTLSQLIIEKVGTIKNYKLLCGVPYTALPIATAISIQTGVPMVLRRKETKDYGTKKLIEGTFNENDNCLIIEDIITSGSSILETVRDLKNAGLEVTDTVVVLNREQGGADILRSKGVNVYSLLTTSELMKYLVDAKCIEIETVEKVMQYMKNTQISTTTLDVPKHDRLKMTFEKRMSHTSNEVGKQLFKIMTEKQTNLCVAVDVTSSSKILQLAEELGPHICILKTHVDIIEDFSFEFIKKLKNIATLHNFLIMEDRKFADIGKTVSYQFTKGLYQISSWADLVTAHALPGKGLIQAISEEDGIKRGIFLVAEMSSAGNLATENYTSSSISLAKDCSEVVTGIVGQSCKFLDSPGLIQLTPGIQLDTSGDNLGQQYNSPENAVLERGADIGVVGRGIILSENPTDTAKNYKTLLWGAYLKRVS